MVKSAALAGPPASALALLSVVVSVATPRRAIAIRTFGPPPQIPIGNPWFVEAAILARQPPNPHETLKSLDEDSEGARKAGAAAGSGAVGADGSGADGAIDEDKFNLWKSDDLQPFPELAPSNFKEWPALESQKHDEQQHEPEVVLSKQSKLLSVHKLEQSDLLSPRMQLPHQQPKQQQQKKQKQLQQRQAEEEALKKKGQQEQQEQGEQDAQEALQQEQQQHRARSHEQRLLEWEQRQYQAIMLQKQQRELLRLKEEQRQEREELQDAGWIEGFTSWVDDLGNLDGDDLSPSKSLLHERVDENGNLVGYSSSFLNASAGFGALVAGQRPGGWRTSFEASVSWTDEVRDPAEGSVRSERRHSMGGQRAEAVDASLNPQARDFVPRRSDSVGGKTGGRPSATIRGPPGGAARRAASSGAILPPVLPVSSRSQSFGVPGAPADGDYGSLAAFSGGAPGSFGGFAIGPGPGAGGAVGGRSASGGALLPPAASRSRSTGLFGVSTDAGAAPVLSERRSWASHIVGSGKDAPRLLVRSSTFTGPSPPLGQAQSFGQPVQQYGDMKVAQPSAGYFFGLPSVSRDLTQEWTTIVLGAVPSVWKREYFAKLLDPLVDFVWLTSAGKAYLNFLSPVMAVKFLNMGSRPFQFAGAKWVLSRTKFEMAWAKPELQGVSALKEHVWQQNFGGAGSRALSMDAPRYGIWSNYPPPREESLWTTVVLCNLPTLQSAKQLLRLENRRLSAVLFQFDADFVSLAVRPDRRVCAVINFASHAGARGFLKHPYRFADKDWCSLAMQGLAVTQLAAMPELGPLRRSKQSLHQWVDFRWPWQ